VKGQNETEPSCKCGLLTGRLLRVWGDGQRTMPPWLRGRDSWGAALGEASESVSAHAATCMAWAAPSKSACASCNCVHREDAHEVAKLGDLGEAEKEESVLCCKGEVLDGLGAVCTLRHLLK
jgi:hypothetical protein